MRIKNHALLFIPLVFLLAAMGNVMRDDIPEGIADSFRKGNSRDLSRHFNDNIELVVPNNEDVYSKSQAELILRNFFSENKPVSFELLHSGGKESSRYAIGNLKTENGDFRISFFLKLRGSTPLIHLLRIEK